LKVGILNLDKRAILSPMAEVTDSPFRKICRDYGAGLTFTQMVSAKGIIENSFDSLKALAYNKNEKPIGIQLLVSDPEYLKKAIDEIKSFEPDLIDLNCGCSVPQVCKYGLGAAILDNPQLLARLVKTMADTAGDIPVSVKIRLGRDKNNITVLRNAKIIEDNGASFITIHARTRNQSYSEPPDWGWIKKVKEEIKIPIVGNGNLFLPDECVKMIKETGCDNIFISRGALGNPFIFNRFNSLIDKNLDPGVPSIDEVATAAIKHLNYILKEYGEEQGIKNARKHLIWYFRTFNGIYNFIDKIFSINKPVLVHQFIIEHIEKIKNGLYPEEDLELVNRNFNERVLFWMFNNQQVETYN
jgi:tRNA-dihydrouridine synthase B